MNEIIEKHRRFLPHLQLKYQIIFLTWKLAFHLPQELLRKIRELQYIQEKMEEQKTGSIGNIYQLYIKKMEELDIFLAKIDVSDINLTNPEIGDMIKNTFIFYDEKLYKLHCFCIMSNHIHLLVQPLIDDNGKFFKISTIVQRIKTYTAKNINMILNRNGKVWDDDYFDRYIRNDKDYYNVINYILNNPVKAGLSEQIEDWQFSYYKPINIFFEDF